VPHFLLPLLQNPLTLPRLRILERKIRIPNGNTQRLLHSLVGQMRHEAAIDEGFLAVLGARGGGAELGDESAAPAETGAGNGEGGEGAEGGEEGEDAGVGGGEAVVEKEADKAGESAHTWEASIYGGGEKQLAACFRWIGDGGEDLRDGK